MATTTRLTLLQRLALALGGYQGNITSGTATTAVLAGLVGVTNDDDLNDSLLAMPDAATDADQARIITDWTGASGTATFGTRADTTYTSETYFTLPKSTFTLQEMRQAISTALRKTQRTYRTIVPTRDDQRDYALADLTWLRNARDVDGVQWRACPNLIQNADFEQWHSGTTSAPDGWTLAGAAGTIARSTTFASYGSYTAQVTRAGTDVTLTQIVPYQVSKQMIDDLAVVAIKVRCRATVASRVRVGINDGTTTTYSSYHSGDSEPEDLTASVTLTAAASRVQIVLSVDTGDTMGEFDFAPMMEASAVGDDFWLGGDASFREHDIDYDILNVGSGVPVLRPYSVRGRKGQYIITSRRPFADLTADANSTEAPSDLIEARTIIELALLDRPAMTRDRAEALLKRYGYTWSQLVDGIIDRPPQRAQTRVVVRGL